MTIQKTSLRRTSSNLFTRNTMRHKTHVQYNSQQSPMKGELVSFSCWSFRFLWLAVSGVFPILDGRVTHDSLVQLANAIWSVLSDRPPVARFSHNLRPALLLLSRLYSYAISTHTQPRSRIYKKFMYINTRFFLFPSLSLFLFYVLSLSS